MHLNKYIAHAGICSRRKAVDYIKAGLVRVNGTIVENPAYQVLPTDTVRVDGQDIKTERRWYIVLNKPKDYLCTVSDERGRKTILELLGNVVTARVYPVGRLDRNTTGVLLISNDGDLVQQLIHPKFEVEKVYAVDLNKALTSVDRNHLLNGIRLDGSLVTCDDITIVQGGRGKQVIVTLHSGKYRVVRRMFELLGYDVVALDRISFAGITKRGLRRGAWRTMTDQEVQALKEMSNRK